MAGRFPFASLMMLCALGCGTSAASPLDELDKLDPALIPKEERFAWQPKELVAVLGTHRGSHWGRVEGLAYRPDGRRIATGGADRVVRIWDAATLREVNVLEGHTGDIPAVAYAPDGLTLASGSHDGTVRLWDVSADRPRLKATLDPRTTPGWKRKPYDMGIGSPASIGLVLFSPDGQTLACASQDEQMREGHGVTYARWDLGTDPPRPLPPLRAVPSSRTGQPHNSSGQRGVADAPGPSDPHETGPLCYSPDGKTLALKGYNGITLWDLSGDLPKARVQIEGNAGACALAISPDGKTLAVGGSRAGEGSGNDFPRAVLIFDLSTSPPKRKAELREFRDDGSITFAKALAFSPDGKTLAISAKGGRLQLWELGPDESRRRATLPGRINSWGSIEFAPDGRSIAACDPRGQLRIWELTGAEPKDVGPPAPAVLTGFDHGRAVLARGADVETWDLSGPAPRRLEGAKPAPKAPAPAPPRRFDALSEDGSRALGHGQTLGSMTLWDARANPPRSLGDLLGSARPSWVATSSVSQVDGRAVVRDSRQRNGPPRTPNYAIAALSADGKLAALGDWDGEIDLWDLSAAAPKQIRTMAGHEQGVSMPALLSLAFSPDGARLASSDSGGRVFVWDLAKGTTSNRWHYPGGTLLRFAPGGHHLVTSNADGTIFVLRLGR